MKTKILSILGLIAIILMTYLYYGLFAYADDAPKQQSKEPYKDTLGIVFPKAEPETLTREVAQYIIAGLNKSLESGDVSEKLYMQYFGVEQPSMYPYNENKEKSQSETLTRVRDQLALGAEGDKRPQIASTEKPLQMYDDSDLVRYYCVDITVANSKCKHGVLFFGIEMPHIIKSGLYECSILFGGKVMFQY